MNRLSYGIKITTIIFQLEIEKSLQRTSGRTNFIDAIIIAGKTTVDT
jgi:hypothetical protein